MGDKKETTKTNKTNKTKTNKTKKTNKTNNPPPCPEARMVWPKVSQGPWGRCPEDLCRVHPPLP